MGFHDSRHTGQTSEVVTPPLTLAWTWQDSLTYDTGNKGQFTPGGYFWLPIYYQGKLYLQGGNNANRIFCLNPATGSQVWMWQNPGYAQAGTYLFQFYNYPAAVNGRIVNASTDFSASIDAGNPANAQATYNTNGGWPSGGVAAWNSMAYMQYVRTDDGTESFQVVQDPVAWSNQTGVYPPDHVNGFTDTSFRVPTVDNYTAYANILGELIAFNATTGWPLWDYGKQSFGSSPAVSNGVVYFYATAQKRMVALNAGAATYPQGGAQVPMLWSVPMPAAYSPIVSDGTIYVGAADGNFYALNAATGATQWTFKTGAAFSSLQIPAISGNLIYVPGADNTLYVLQKSNGAEVWHYTGTAAWGPVIISGGMVFASDLTKTFYAFQPQSTATGPTVSSLSVQVAPNNTATSVSLTGNGFFAGGTASAVQNIVLDNSAGTVLSGYSVVSDQSITGVVLPAGTAPGTYHIKVKTSVGSSSNEPALTVEPANTLNITTLGYTNGPNGYGTNIPSQRHLIRTSSGMLVSVYMGPSNGDEPQYPSYNFSLDGGLTWSGQGQFFLSNQGTVIYSPWNSIWIDAQDQLNVSSIQWPSYNETIQKFTINPLGVLTQDSGFPVYPAGGTAKTGVQNGNMAGPVVTEPGGRLWVAFEPGSNYTGPILSYYSDDGGLTWTSGGQINKAPGTSPAMVLYQGHPAVIYSDGGVLAWAAWNGQAWSAPQVLPGPISNVGYSLSAAVTSSGQVAVVYSPSTGGVYFTSYNGQNWLAPAALDPTGASPSITTDGTNLWAFYTNAAGNLVYRQTTNGGWNAAVAITSDGNQNTAAATLPVSPGGQVPVVWTAGTASNGYVVKATTVPNVASPQTPPPPLNPVLSVTKSNAASFYQGENGATYTVSVSNASGAGATSGAVTVTDSEPAGLTLTGMSGNGWSCSGNICTRNDALSGGSSYPAITVTVNVAGNAAASLTSQASVSGGGSASATTSAVTTIVSSAVLSIGKTHSGSFYQGQNGATYQITVGNSASAGPTAGTVTVTDTEPSGLTLAAMSGSGWGCSGNTCARSDQLASGATYPPITVTVNVAGNATASLTSQATVSGGGSASATASDVTAIGSGPGLGISKTHSGGFYQGESGATYTVVVSNAASAAPTSGTVTVADSEPAGLVLAGMSGNGWACSGNACTRSDVLNGGSGYPAITVTVNVAASAAASVTSQATVSGGGSASATASDVTAIASGPGLTITKTHSGSFYQGESGATYNIVVSNAVSAAPTSGTVTVTDNEPAGLTLTGMAGNGWACSGNSCTRSDALNGGSSYPAIIVTVNVATGAATSVTSQASVSGGGSASATASDVTSIVQGCAFSFPAAVSLNNSVSGATTPASQGFSIAITPRGGCTGSTTWTAAAESTAYWLTVTAGTNGNGSSASMLQASGLANTQTAPRSGSITITPSNGGPVTVMVTQAPASSTTPLIDLQVTALYQTVLDRDPDASGYAFWTGGGVAGLGQMLDSFLTSAEGFNFDFAVMAAYQAATGAPPTYAQFRVAVTALRAGQVSIATLFGSLAPQDYTPASLYQNLLGRAPSASEAAAVNSQGLSYAFQSLIGFPAVNSPAASANNEFQSTGSFAGTSAAADHTNALFVRMLYYTILLRDPDPAGLQYWTGVANSGGAGVLFQGNAGLAWRLAIEGTSAGQGFAGSAEFQGLY